MITQADRTCWTIYSIEREANAAALEEAASTGVIQYVIKKPNGYIITPDNVSDPNAAFFLPPGSLSFEVLGKTPRELTAVDISEIEAIARADATQDFYELLATRMYRLSPSEITDQHIYAVKEEVMRIRNRYSWGESAADIPLKLID
jgi:hypothetical protein